MFRLFVFFVRLNSEIKKVIDYFAGYFAKMITYSERDRPTTPPTAKNLNPPNGGAEGGSAMVFKKRASFLSQGVDFPQQVTRSLVSIIIDPKKFPYIFFLKVFNPKCAVAAFMYV
ncbi:hypothetical protein [Bacillus mycoides]|uniref:hypothetical protein n=1 Tax=Bacillus mycoides TaxID=1405 RepID=UPI003CF2AF32